MPLMSNPGTLIVASAYPDPPFDLMENGSATGFDIELIRAICAQLGLSLRPVPYSGDDFNGIFEGLAHRSCDAVISGTTITPERSRIVQFSQPYLEFNQGIAVNRRLTPHVFNPAIPLTLLQGACWPKGRSLILDTIHITASAPPLMTLRRALSVW